MTDINTLTDATEADLTDTDGYALQVDDLECSSEWLDADGDLIGCVNPIGWHSGTDDQPRGGFNSFTTDSHGARRCEDCSNHYAEHGTDDDLEVPA